MMTKRITKKPNLNKLADRKNENGICAVTNCKNKLDDPHTLFFGTFKVCKTCMKSLNILLDEILIS